MVQHPDAAPIRGQVSVPPTSTALAWMACSLRLQSAGTCLRSTCTERQSSHVGVSSCMVFCSPLRAGRRGGLATDRSSAPATRAAWRSSHPAAAPCRHRAARSRRPQVWRSAQPPWLQGRGSGESGELGSGSAAAAAAGGRQNAVAGLIARSALPVRSACCQVSGQWRENQRQREDAWRTCAGSWSG